MGALETPRVSTDSSAGAWASELKGVRPPASVYTSGPVLASRLFTSARRRESRGVNEASSAVALKDPECEKSLAKLLDPPKASQGCKARQKGVEAPLERRHSLLQPGHVRTRSSAISGCSLLQFSLRDDPMYRGSMAAEPHCVRGFESALGASEL
jgi:hypothetical protein